MLPDWLSSKKKKMKTKTVNIPKRPARKFVAEELVVDSWNKIASYFQDLLDREIHSVEDLEKWMLDRSELEAVLEEEQAWRYIKMNIDTRNVDLSDSFTFWIKEISPNVAHTNYIQEGYRENLHNETCREEDAFV